MHVYLFGPQMFPGLRRVGVSFGLKT